MKYTNSAFFRLLALMLALVLCLAGCGGKKDEQGNTPDPTTASATEPKPTEPTPTEPKEPPVLTKHQQLLSYLNDNGAQKVEQNGHTFTMRAEGKDIVWEYQNSSTNVKLTLSETAAVMPVTIKFAIYDATAEVDVASYSSVGGELTNFNCPVQDVSQSIKDMATATVRTCFLQAAKLMERSGVTLVDLGFVNYFN